jgi:hypothetical protein
LVDLFKVSYSKIRGTVDALANINAIRTRPKPGDNRTTEIHKDSLDTIKQAARLLGN